MSNGSVTISIELLHRLKKDQSAINIIRELALSCKDPEEFHNKCLKALEVSSKLEERLNKKDEYTK